MSTTQILDRPTAVQINVPDLGQGDKGYRCDACGAQAFFHAAKITGARVSELLFCGHHGKKSEPGLVAQGFSVSDQTEKINDKPSISANAE